MINEVNEVNEVMFATDVKGLETLLQSYSAEKISCSPLGGISQLSKDGYDTVVVRLSTIGAQANNINDKIKIIAITAYVMEKDRKMCLAAGMDEYLAKPFKPKELLDLIDYVL